MHDGLWVSVYVCHLFHGNTLRTTIHRPVRHRPNTDSDFVVVFALLLNHESHTGAQGISLAKTNTIWCRLVPGWGLKTTPKTHRHLLESVIWRMAPNNTFCGFNIKTVL